MLLLHYGNQGCYGPIVRHTNVADSGDRDPPQTPNLCREVLPQSRYGLGGLGPDGAERFCHVTIYTVLLRAKYLDKGGDGLGGRRANPGNEANRRISDVTVVGVYRLYDSAQVLLRCVAHEVEGAVSLQAMITLPLGHPLLDGVGGILRIRTDRAKGDDRRGCEGLVVEQFAQGEHGGGGFGTVPPQ